MFALPFRGLCLVHIQLSFKKRWVAKVVIGQELNLDRFPQALATFCKPKSPQLKLCGDICESIYVFFVVVSRAGRVLLVLKPN